MGRGRGKGKKQTVITASENLGSGEEGKIQASRRRGRPQKPLKDTVKEDEEIYNIQDDDENNKSSITSKSSADEIDAINESKKRKRSLEVKENSDDHVKEDNKSLGFRQNGSRRKSKPRRAAEVGLECK